MEKIKMTTPLVEMDGDEMTRVLWKIIKEELILPFVDLKTEYYDLGLPNRDATQDQVTMDAALANKKYGVAVKCATITPNAQRVEEYHLHQMWKSPNGTIRAVLDGTVFRAPIMIDSIKPVVRNWTKPITIARHAYGDVYKCTEFRIPGPGRAELIYTGDDGSRQAATVYNFECAGVLQGQYNKDTSIYRSEEHTSELQSPCNLVCRLLLEKNFFNDTATTEIYTLSLHDALPIWISTRCSSRSTTCRGRCPPAPPASDTGPRGRPSPLLDRKSVV